MYYQADDYYKKYLIKLEKAIKDYLDIENVDYSNCKTIEELAELGDNTWKYSQLNSKRLGKRVYNRHGKDFKKEFSEYYVNHTMAQTAIHFNILKTTASRYAVKFGLKMPRELKNTNWDKVGNVNSIFRRCKSCKKKKENITKKKEKKEKIEKVDPSVFKDKIIKFR